MTDRCTCGLPLVYELEIEYGFCEGCLEAQYERSREAREWDYYHPADDAPQPPEPRSVRGGEGG